MSLSSWLKLLKTWRSRTTKPRRPRSYRPSLEVLEERLTPFANRIWSGGDFAAAEWSATLNWENPALVAFKPPVLADDSVTLPADAARRNNVVNIEHFSSHPDTIFLVVLTIEGGNYTVNGNQIILKRLDSLSGTNVIHNPVRFLNNNDQLGDDGFLRHITVDAGSLSLSDLAVTRLSKDGAGILELGNTQTILDLDVNAGELTMQSGARIVFELDSFFSPSAVLNTLDIAAGARLHLQQGGDQIANNIEVRIGALGVLDLDGVTEGVGVLTLSGGRVTTGTGTFKVVDRVNSTISNVSAQIEGSVDLESTTRTFTVANGLALNDLIVEGAIQGTAGLVKAGEGRLVFSGTTANTYSGRTNVNAGVLHLAKSDSVLAVAGELVIGDGAGSDQVVLLANQQIASVIPVRINSSGFLNLNNHNETLGGLILVGSSVSGNGGLLTLLGNVTAESAPTTAAINGRLSIGGIGPDPSRTFTVANGAAANDLVVQAGIIGSAGLVKEGTGQLVLSGTEPNSYAGRTTVNAGILVLNKSPGFVAVTGELVVGDGVGGANADIVRWLVDNQVGGSLPVRVNSSGLLDLNGRSDGLTGLTLAGGNVTTSGGLLTLLGNVTAESSPTRATISGRLGLNGPPRVFTVADGVSGTDLLVNAVIEGAGLTKTGPGTMELTAANTYTGDSVVNDGRLLVNGALTNSRVRLNAGGSLAGGGTVAGITATGGSIQPGDGVGTLTSTASVTLQAGSSILANVIPVTGDPHDRLKVQGTVNLGGASLSVQPTFLPAIGPQTTRLLDNGDPGFTTTPGYQVFTSPGSGFFADDVHFAAAGTGTEQASWTFSNLTPGSYRVSTTWLKDLNRATNSPFTILNGTTPVTTVQVNQELDPADFAAFGFNWDILGVVQVTGTSLTVRLTNSANDFVLADAVLIQPHQFVIVDNDGTDAVVGTFAGLPEGAQVLAVAVGFVNGQPQQQTQVYNISYRANTGNDVGLAYLTTATTAQNLLLTPAAINEGGRATLTGNLTDPDAGDSLTLTINWGDGTTETHHPGTRSFSFAHRYRDNPPGQPHGAYTVHIAWFDQHGKGNSRDLTITVHNVAPALHLPGDQVVRAGGLLVVPGYFTDPGRDTWTATVNYGDGSGVQALSLNPAQHFLLRHRYERPGTYRVTVEITDDAGESSTETLLVHVDELRPNAARDALLAIWSS